MYVWHVKFKTRLPFAQKLRSVRRSAAHARYSNYNNNSNPAEIRKDLFGQIKFEYTHPKGVAKVDKRHTTAWLLMLSRGRS